MPVSAGSLCAQAHVRSRDSTLPGAGCLAAAGIRHRYEEFDDDHSDIDYRMDASLPFLYRVLKP